MIELERLHRGEWGHLLSALIRVLGDFDLAEDALQEAFAAAVVAWAGGAPRNPGGWLYATARHKALDRLRRQRRLAARLELEPEAPPEVGPAEEEAVPDERLRLFFTCCHPALSPEAQVALTLRTLGGLSTEEIARAFLVPAPTLAQRLVRAKAKIREAGIPYAVPGPEELPERLGAVMSVLYLVFNEGYSPAQGEALLRPELCEEAIGLARTLRGLLGPAHPDLDGLLALMLLHHARRHARLGPDGEVVLLADQDRTRWDPAEIAEGVRLVEGALRNGPPSTWALEAAIAAVHDEAPTAAQTDWPQIVRLYQLLHRLHPSPVVALNQAVAVAMAEGPEAGLARVEALARELEGYHLWHAARADLLRRLGRGKEALSAYRRADALCENAAERRFLARRIAELKAGPQ